MFSPDDLIHSYSRSQAIADGLLVDVSEAAREAGFRYPVAMTRAAWHRCVRVPPGVVCQDEGGRLWDVLWMLRVAVGRSRGGREVVFGVLVRDSNAEGAPPVVQLRAVCGPGDKGERVITVVLDGED